MVDVCGVWGDEVEFVNGRSVRGRRGGRRGVSE